MPKFYIQSDIIFYVFISLLPLSLQLAAAVLFVWVFEDSSSFFSTSSPNWNSRQNDAYYTKSVQLAQLAHAVYTTSPQRRCNVMHEVASTLYKRHVPAWSRSWNIVQFRYLDHSELTASVFQSKMFLLSLIFQIKYLDRPLTSLQPAPKMILD